MKASLKERVTSEAQHIIATHDTIRKTAKLYGYSKSTVHSDVSDKLRFINPIMHQKVKAILEENFADKHNRGGQATKEKYLREEIERE